jgi:hypothetical protein
MNVCLLAYPLEDLLPADVNEPPIKFLHLSDNTLNLALVLTLDLTCLSNYQVDGQFNSSPCRPCP